MANELTRLIMANLAGNGYTPAPPISGDDPAGRLSAEEERMLTGAIHAGADAPETSQRSAPQGYRSISLEDLARRRR